MGPGGCLTLQISIYLYVKQIGFVIESKTADGYPLRGDMTVYLDKKNQDL